MLKLCLNTHVILQFKIKHIAMKTFLLTTTTLVTALFNGAIAQHSGNANYSNSNYQSKRINTIQTTSSNPDEMTITIKGIYNEKASSQIATFSVLQLGKTAKETTDLMSERLKNATNELKTINQQVSFVIDMISFVPTYGYTVEKRVFNPKTYNETPTGFELRKNIIIKYNNNSDLDQIIAILSKYEIYDLVKVNYITNNYDLIRTQMQKKALEQLKAHLSSYSLMMNTDLNKKEKTLQEGFNTSYPMENYRNYQAYAKASINPGQKDEVNEVAKNTTQYYNSIVPNEHQFIFNADVVEPTIQLFYELTVKIKLKEDQLPKNTIVKNNRYYIITAKGDIKPLNL